MSLPTISVPLPMSLTAAAWVDPPPAAAWAVEPEADFSGWQAVAISDALAEYQAILPGYAALAHQEPGKAMAVRDRIGKLLIATGRPREAWPVLVGLLQDQERVLGPHHPDTLALRTSLDQLDIATRPRQARQDAATPGTRSGPR
jgi:hypothetical protein